MNFSRPTIKGVLLAATFLAAPLLALAPEPASAQAVVAVGIQIAPPPLPVYAQPAMPAAGYIWTPGYWAYAQTGYYWVPGTWVQPPTVGVLWTPPYWAWLGGAYVFHAGYWGPHVGFYGGVNYGFGYGGNGYEGGRWNDGHFAYNRSVNNFGSVHVTNVYNTTVIHNNRSQISYVGGPHGLKAEPTAQQRAFERESHIPATSIQTRHMAAAEADPAFAASHNHGHPAIAATSRPAVMTAPGREHAAQPQANAHAPGLMNAERPPIHAAPHQPQHAPQHPMEHAAPHQAAVPHPVQHAAPQPIEHPASHQPQHASQPPMEHAAPHPAAHAPPHPAPAHDARPEERK